MIRILTYILVAFITIHGLIHLMGFAAYWPLATIEGLPYKTALLNGSWSIGPNGMRTFSVVWLFVAVGFVVSAVGLSIGQDWWSPLLWGVIILSSLIAVLDWHNAYLGAIINLVILIFLLVVMGLRLEPKPFQSYQQSTPSLNMARLPEDLPPPVNRYYQTIIGDEVPVIESAVITGRGTLRFADVTFPARLRFTHDAGKGYRHYIESTFYGYPIMTVDEWYLDGHAKLAMPVGLVENEPKIDMAANLGLWGESIWLPSIFVTDPRVRWRGIDDATAKLIVPFEDGEDRFTVYFDPDTDLICSMEAMRYRDAADEEKILWQLEVQEWGSFDGILIPSQSSAKWADQTSPWLNITVEEVSYNVNVSDYIQGEGP